MRIDEATRILRDLRMGDFRLTRHARQRMDERNVGVEDIQRCADTARRAELQDNGCFIIQGSDLHNDPLQIVAAWDGETLVVTIIGK